METLPSFLEFRVTHKARPTVKAQKLGMASREMQSASEKRSVEVSLSIFFLMEALHGTHH